VKDIALVGRIWVIRPEYYKKNTWVAVPQDVLAGSVCQVFFLLRCGLGGSRLSFFYFLCPMLPLSLDCNFLIVSIGLHFSTIVMIQKRDPPQSTTQKKKNLTNRPRQDILWYSNPRVLFIVFWSHYSFNPVKCCRWKENQACNIYISKSKLLEKSQNCQYLTISNAWLEFGSANTLQPISLL
jgi:hypothetical protein